jgi:4-hydroxy-tetrahydrodipicolinate reductase
MQSGNPCLSTQKSLKFGLIGYGKMGKMVEELAPKQGHRASLDLKESDVLIDFSHRDALFKNLQQAADLQKALVIGTTGWEDLLPKVKQFVADHDVGVLYAPNFSIGVFLFLKTVAQACKLLGPTHLYDVAGFEVHHHQKQDAPSGTAHALKQTLLDNWPSDVEDFASIRVGSTPGTHTIIFDSPEDTMTFTHQAKSRKAFAEGAIHAACWLKGKKGLFTFEDIFHD